MKKLVLIAVMAAAFVLPAGAQQRPATQDGNTPAVNSPNSPPNTAAPVAGANSFTEGQAKSLKTAVSPTCPDCKKTLLAFGEERLRRATKPST